MRGKIFAFCNSGDDSPVAVDSSAVRRDGGCWAAVNTRPLNLDAAVGKTARPEGLKSDIKENRKRGGEGGAE